MVRDVAKVTEAFIKVKAFTPFSIQSHITSTVTQQMANTGSDQCAWKIGPGYIQLEDLVIVGADIISSDRIQPVLAVFDEGVL